MKKRWSFILNTLVLSHIAIATQSHAQLKDTFDFGSAQGLPVATTHFVGESSAPVNITDTFAVTYRAAAGWLIFQSAVQRQGLRARMCPSGHQKAQRRWWWAM